MMRPAFIALGLLGAVTAVAAQGRLVSQRIYGGYRVCVYEVRHLPGRNRAQGLRVGMGEPCPARYRRPSPPPALEIPADARLDGARRVGGRTVCVYVRFGRRYSRPAPLNGTCPLTAGAGR